MKKTEFESELAAIIIDQVKNPATRGRVTRMEATGHFNGRVFKPHFFLKLRFVMFVRIMVNLAMELTYNEFMTVWDRLGKRIFSMGDNNGDTYNDIHRRCFAPNEKL